jgi:hypothetical protein
MNILAGYKTYIAAALFAVFGALAATDWISVLDDPKAGAVAVGGSILMALMRAVTNAPGPRAVPVALLSVAGPAVFAAALAHRAPRAPDPPPPAPIAAPAERHAEPVAPPTNPLRPAKRDKRGK